MGQPTLGVLLRTRRLLGRGEKSGAGRKGAGKKQRADRWRGRDKSLAERGAGVHENRQAEINGLFFAAHAAVRRAVYGAGRSVFGSGVAGWVRVVRHAAHRVAAIRGRAEGSREQRERREENRQDEEHGLRATHRWETSTEPGRGRYGKESVRGRHVAARNGSR